VVVDSSVLVAVIMDEPLAADLFKMLVRAPVVSVGAPSVLESCMVLGGRLPAGGQDAARSLALLLATLEVDVVPFQAAHWPVAWSAFIRYGKGRHPARLNFGDCMTYATAMLAGQPLLCLGDDFAQTDLDLMPLPDR